MSMSATTGTSIPTPTAPPATSGWTACGTASCPELCDANARLQRFFLEHDRTCVYAVDGTPVDETVLHPVGFIAATAEGSLAAMHSQEPDALDNAIRWVRLLWDTPIRTGTRRYYDNFLYAFAFLALAGEYRTW